MKMSRFVICLLMIPALQFPLHGWAQGKQLKPVDMPAKFAFVDGAKLRKEYRAYTAAKDSMFKDGMAKRKSFNEARKQPGANQSELDNKHAAEAKLQSQARQAFMKTYEDKMRAAIQLVMAQGVYTELRPLKDSANVKGTNITDLILAKLNQ
jgi:hypothetical protein